MTSSAAAVERPSNFEFAPQPEKEAWHAPKAEPVHLDADDFARWKSATMQVRNIAQRDGLSKTAAAHRIGIPLGTFSPWYDGTYTGNFAPQTARVVKWLSAVEERLRTVGDLRVPDFVETPTAAEIIETLIYAQAVPDIVIITLGAGMGKTVAATHFAATRPHAFLVTMRPTTRKVFGMLSELSAKLGVVEHRPGQLDRAIGEHLKRNGRHTLLEVDEAQHLEDEAVNQLRHYHDLYGCGIALLGNEELYGRFGGHAPKPAYAQIHRRIGKRLKRLTPQQGDIDALVAAWHIKDAEIAGLLRAIGRQPGALSQITKTMVLAGMLAAGVKQPISADHVRKAWANRGGDSLRAA